MPICKTTFFFGCPFSAPPRAATASPAAWRVACSKPSFVSRTRMGENSPTCPSRGWGPFSPWHFLQMSRVVRDTPGWPEIPCNSAKTLRTSVRGTALVWSPPCARTKISADCRSGNPVVPLGRCGNSRRTIKVASFSCVSTNREGCLSTIVGSCNHADKFLLRGPAAPVPLPLWRRQNSRQFSSSRFVVRPFRIPPVSSLPNFWRLHLYRGALRLHDCRSWVNCSRYPYGPRLCDL